MSSRAERQRKPFRLSSGDVDLGIASASGGERHGGEEIEVEIAKGRTVASVPREAEGSLLATQLLLAQGALALQTTSQVAVVLPSVRKVLLEMRGEIRNIVGRHHRRIRRS